MVSSASSQFKDPVVIVLSVSISFPMSSERQQVMMENGAEGGRDRGHLGPARELGQVSLPSL